MVFGNAIRMGMIGPIQFYGDLRELVLRERADTEQLPVKQMTWKRPQGKHLGSMSLMTMFLVCYRPEHAHAVLRESTYRQGIVLFDMHLRNFLGPDAIVMLMKQPWKDVRTVLVKAFRNSDLASMSIVMRQCSWSFARRLCEVQQIDFLQASKGCTIDIIGQSAFGYDFGGIASLGSGGNAVGDAFTHLLDDVTDRQFRPTIGKAIYWLPTERNRQHAEASRVVRGTLDRIITERLSVPTERKGHDLLDSMLQASREGGALTSLSKEALSDNLLTFMFAGFDTMSIALTYALYLLAMNPDKLARLQKEVDTVLDENPEVTSRDLKSLPYCTKVVKETLRLYPPAPLTARTTTSPVDLGDGVQLEAGVRVMIPIWRVHRDEQVWPEPEVFEPDRFDAELPHGAWIPFSDGLRNCVGYRFAMTEATIILAVLARALTWRLQDGYTLRPKDSGVVQVPADGMPLSFEARSGVKL